MAMNDVPLDDKAKRTRNLLSSFYVTDSSSTSNAFSSSPRRTTLESINTQVFDADEYMKLLVQKSNLEGLLRKHVEMAAEIKNLDTDLQMLVYENYNKFISATETIKRMKNNIVGMETNMEQLLEKIMSVQSKSDGINTSLFEKRERIEKLHRTRNFLHKVQFIYDLPTRLGKCIKTEAYADAVRFYTGAMPIFKAYGDSSFRDCKRACEEAIDTIIKNLQGKLYSDSEPVEARAEAVVLLRHLDFPVDGLKMKLLEKLEAFLSEFQSKSGFGDVSVYSNEDLNIGNGQPSTIPDTTDVQASIVEISEAIRAYRIIFPDLEKRLIELVQDLFNTRFGKIEKHITERISSKDLLVMLQNIWKDVKVMDEALAEAALPIYSLEGARAIVKQYISTAFSNLLLEVSGILKQVQSSPKEEFEGGETLQIVFEASKKTIIHGSMNLLLDFRHLLDDSLELLVNLRDLIIDWVQEGFQEFFRTLDSHFLSLSGKNIAPAPDRVDELKMEKVHPGLALVLSQVSIFIEQNAIPQITEEIAASFSGGGVRKYEYGPAFIPGEICRIFRSSSEKLLHLYISNRTQKISLILKKRFTTPNWIKHKEPREVHMFVDLLLQELESIENEVKHVLPHGLLRKHRRSESTGSTASSRSNPTREDKNNRSNSQRAKSQLLENHLARLFKQKVEIITKVEPTQESIVSSIVKLCLRSLQEFVRLQTFNRSGFQQIQLDTQFLKNTLKDIVLDEAAVEFLIDEVVVSAAERCLDVIPLDNAILDKLVQAKLIKKKETNPTY